MALAAGECCDTLGVVVVLAVVVVVVVVVVAAVVGQNCFHCCCGDVEALVLNPENVMGIVGTDVVAVAVAVVVAVETLRLVRETGVVVVVEGVENPGEQRKDP